MCSEVQTPTRSLGSIRALREAGLVVLPSDYLGEDETEDPPVAFDGVEYAYDQFCLCGVDTRAIADRSGLPYHWDNEWGEVVFEVEPTNESGLQ